MLSTIMLYSTSLLQHLITSINHSVLQYRPLILLLSLYLFIIIITILLIILLYRKAYYNTWLKLPIEKFYLPWSFFNPKQFGTIYSNEQLYNKLHIPNSMYTVYNITNDDLANPDLSPLNNIFTTIGYSISSSQLNLIKNYIIHKLSGFNHPPIISSYLKKDTILYSLNCFPISIKNNNEILKCYMIDNVWDLSCRYTDTFNHNISMHGGLVLSAMTNIVNIFDKNSNNQSTICILKSRSPIKCFQYAIKYEIYKMNIDNDLNYDFTKDRTRKFNIMNAQSFYNFWSIYGPSNLGVWIYPTNSHLAHMITAKEIFPISITSQGKIKYVFLFRKKVSIKIPFEENLELIWIYKNKQASGIDAEKCLIKSIILIKQSINWIPINLYLNSINHIQISQKINKLGNEYLYFINYKHDLTDKKVEFIY